MLTKQRGIYSQTVHPHNAAEFDRHELVGGPGDAIIVHSFEKINFAKSATKLRLNRAAQPVLELKAEDPQISVEPLVKEPFEPIPGKVPRRVAIDRKKKEYQSYHLNALFKEAGIEFKKRADDWLQLTLFDNRQYDDCTSEELLAKRYDESGTYHPLTGKGLRLNSEGIWKYRSLVVQSFDGTVYRGRWRKDGVVFTLHRIFICFDCENPRKYVQRVSEAFRQRLKADNLIRYNYVIDNMPLDDLSELDNEQKRRITLMTQKGKFAEDGAAISALLGEVNNDFKRTMCKIILDLEIDKTPNLLGFTMPRRPDPPETRERDLLPLEREKGVLEIILKSPKEKYPMVPRSFKQLRNQFCFATLFMKAEVISAMQEIKQKCSHVEGMQIFDLRANEAMHLDQYKHLQQSAQSYALYNLKGSWIPQLVGVIKGRFSEVGKGWFNMKQTSKTTYDFGKLKKFLTMVRLMMENTLLSLIKSNYNSLVQFIEQAIPEAVVVRSAAQVENHYSGPPKEPLFQIELVKTLDLDITYSTRDLSYVHVVLALFEKTLDEFAKIPDIEPAILAELYKSQKNETFIKSPIKSKDRPKMPDPNQRPLKLPDENLWLWDLYDRLSARLAKAVEPLGAYLSSYGGLKAKLKVIPDEYVLQLQMEEPPRQIGAIRSQVLQLMEYDRELPTLIPEKVQVGFFEVNCRTIQVELREINRSLINNLINYIAKRIRQRILISYTEYETIKQRVNAEPKNIEQLTDLTLYFGSLDQRLQKIREEVDQCFQNYKVVQEFNYRFSSEEFKKRWAVFSAPRDIASLVEARSKAMDKLKAKFMEQMKESQKVFQSNFQSTETTILGFHESFNRIDNFEEAYQAVKIVGQSLENYFEESRKFSIHENMFGVEATDYSRINQMARDFQPYSNLWTVLYEWHCKHDSWMNGAWPTIEVEDAERLVEEWIKTLAVCARQFSEKKIVSMQKIAESIRQEVERFRPKVPVLRALKKKGLKTQHLQEISRAIGSELAPDRNFTFTEALELGVLNYSDKIVEIGERASKEYVIEVNLEKMKREWEAISFEVVPYKPTKDKGPEQAQNYVVRSYEAISNKLDEHIVNTQTLQFSPYKRPFEEELAEWDGKLRLMSDVVDEWIKFQQQWMYLQPIFDSPDISKQLPQESKRFRTIDNSWRYNMNQVRAQPNVLKNMCEPGLLQRMRDVNKNIELIQKELNNYLEKKKEKFARFFFLSNLELLEILSQAKEPLAVQPHLKKVFQNINRIEFSPEKRILAMLSEEKECIRFVKPIDPAKKNVEDWMNELEQQMKVSVKSVLRKGIELYPASKRTQWVLEHPGQVVLNASQVFWTKELEDAILQKPTDPPPEEEVLTGLARYFALLQKQLLDLVVLVRQKLTKQQKTTLGALIVIDVHARDVAQRLKNLHINEVGAFQWISQLRYYFQEELMVRCLQTNFPYGYQYLGNTLRLVITPLTDKCYMTLMSALRLNLGGAPAGPAGTGKTETTKDLAKALAKQCLVFNCSSEMDFIMIGKFFKGLASAGAWACFDEFNRINIQVLSVVAQQLLVLFGEKAKGTPSLVFQESNIRLNPYFSVFITMNPGYAGRTELPDNLKALFRPVAMMVPDYSMIGEILLYSFGFEKGRELARKMVATFKLASEQLSSQDHYDYGMRAVRSVINAAGILKVAHPELNQEQLLLRALRDVNVPKFLKDDLPLFESIISDLFPNVPKPSESYGVLVEAVRLKCQEHKLQPVPSFITKVLQLYDTIQVRHGLMLVGPTGGGKTCNFKVLEQAITSLRGTEQFTRVHSYVLNPKAITMGQLYGQFQEYSHEWTDGVLASIVRDTCADESKDRHWIMFDGPVDALWIESMNTVLDDNKKLCLNSGQILILTPQMTMMFEVEDLAVASPATVSRCGMVYMEPVSLGVLPLIDSWLLAFPASIHNRKKEVKSSFDRNLKVVLERALEYKRRNLKEVIPTPANMLARNLLKLVSCFLRQFEDSETRKVTAQDLTQLEKGVGNVVAFCLAWSVGCTTNLEGRALFSSFLRSACKLIFPEEGGVYDYWLDKSELKWVSWRTFYSRFQIEHKLGYHEITIPTADTTRNKAVMRLLIQGGFHLLTPGPTGTGKTLSISNLLSKELPQTFQYIYLSFSAQTSANQTQDTIESKMNRRSKRRLGPPIGKKCVIFIDDFNMPKKEEFGAQPPIELIRQFLDHGFWYNRKELYTVQLEDVVLLCAMGFPGGGRNPITDRCLSHFNMITYTDLDASIIKDIFNALTLHFFKKFSHEIRDLVQALVGSVVETYFEVSRQFLPTPTKSHYTFNLRDLWKVFQGVCTVRALSSGKEALGLFRLIYHEMSRVFTDRLATDKDREQMESLILKLVPQELRPDLFHGQSKLIFVDFLKSRELDRPYVFVEDVDRFITIVERYQEDYNSEYSGKKGLRLVLFLDACEHVARISRILRFPMGNALLLGVGGSGRQSVARLASFINNFKVVQVQISKNYSLKLWREDVKNLLLTAGLQNRQQVFLLTDTQIVHEQMMEDLNSILSTADVTGIYQEDELQTITETCKQTCIKAGIQPNKMNIFANYLSRVRASMRCVVAMSPVGSAFTTRLRMFPALVSCCTIDWFSEWPEEALLGVGLGQLNEFEDDLGIRPSVQLIVSFFKRVHKNVEAESLRFKEELRRSNYVTPTSYLELINLFRSTLTAKRKEWKFQTSRLLAGLEKLNAANEAVQVMRKELKLKQPILIEAQEETNRMMKVIGEDKLKARQVQKKAEEQERIATKSKDQAMKLKREIEEQVANANRKLVQTKQRMSKLKPTHIQDLRTFSSPPQVHVVVLTGLCILFRDSIAGKANDEIFAIAKKRIMSKDCSKFTASLLQYNIEENMDNGMKDKLEKYVFSQPKFNEADAKNGGGVSECIYYWVKGCYDYYTEWKESEPHRERLREALAEVAQKEAALNQVKEVLEKTNSNIRYLQQQYEDKAKMIDNLSKEILNCKGKLERAQKLTDGLKEEKLRWSEETKVLAGSQDIILGNCCLASAMLAYAGPFVSSFRSRMEQRWNGFLEEEKLSHSPGLTMRKYLGDELKIQEWNAVGLPKDDSSVENGIIIDNSRRYPLMIDPQGQANKFLKRISENNDKEISFQVIKASDPNLLRSLQQSIQFGRWVLVENVGSEVDPALEPILLQQVSRNGNENTIAIGEKLLVLHDNFRIFMTTVLPNPQYSPETSAKVTIINFAITKTGLEEQMLACCISLEAPNLQAKKIEIVRKNAEDRRELNSIEDDIFKSLSESKGGISQLIDDESLIIKLQISKKKSIEINQRFKDSKLTEQEIDQSRDSYRPVAFRASMLFFCIIDLGLIDPMYQYSLQWFMALFKISCENSEKKDVLQDRLQVLINDFTYAVYTNVCRSLFERNKIMFSMLLTYRILEGYGKVDDRRWRYLLTGPTENFKLRDNPTSWISENSWPDIYRNIKGLSHFEGLHELEEYFMANTEFFQELYQSSNPGAVCLPPGLEQLPIFDKMLLIKALRPDKAIPEFQKWVTHVLDERFTKVPVFDLGLCYGDTTASTPLIFVLTTGSDPISDFIKFAEEMNMAKRYESISLGQGQGDKAKKLVTQCIAKGSWALLQNCHLAQSWMPHLEELVEGLGDGINKDFRLWLTSMPSEHFPISVLQNGIKMTLQPPKGLKNSLQRCYQRLSNRELTDCKRPQVFKKLLFSLCMFHAVVQERKKFGPIGWNILYQFTSEDLDVSRRQLSILLNEYEKPPFQVINYLVAEMNYGGRVTDDKDLRLIRTIVESLICPEALREKFKYSPSGIYISPPAGTQADYLAYIDSLPSYASPEILGLHDNSEIVNSQNQTFELLADLLSIQPRDSAIRAGGQSEEAFVEEFLGSIQKMLPPRFDIEMVSKLYPTDYAQSMNTVLVQEVMRYDRLLSVIGVNLTQLKKALKGLIVMSQDLEQVNTAFFNNRVPKLWEEVSFLSMKPLSLWFQDLQRRVQFLSKWISTGTPHAFWISGFFFPQAFITGTLQNFARRQHMAIDRLSFDFKYLPISPESVTAPPDVGCYVYGIFLEGCRWDKRKNIIINPKPKELFSELPLLHLVPLVDREGPAQNVYNCPLYKVVSRRGILSTTGHSTNFVMHIELPSKQNEEMWIRAGVAALLSLKN